MPITKLNRTLIRLSGEGVQDWLSGLITNSLDGNMTFAALLTPQGKIIADFFVIKDNDDLILDSATKFGDTLIKRLSMYRLRAPIDISQDERSVYAAWDGTGDEGYADPRHDALGRRIISDRIATEDNDDAFNLHRLKLGIPDSQWDFDSSEVFPANANMDRLAGVDFKKGCFVGQEVVSRMYRKTEVKKRMVGFEFTGDMDGKKITGGDRVLGEVMHVHDQNGMAMMRLDRLADNEMSLMVGSTDINLFEITHGNSA